MLFLIIVIYINCVMENLKLPLFRLKLLTSAILFSSLVNVFFSQQYTIVNGNTTNQDIPIDPYYDYTICQTIYEQSLLTNAGASPGQITHLSWEYYAGTGTHNEEIVIYMGNTMQDDYASSSSWIDAKTLTLVYQGPASFTATGWSQITLQTPFNEKREISFEGVVKYVGARIDPSIRGVDVIADVKDVGNSQIRGGAFVEVIMQGNKLSNVASIPEDALFTDNENIDFVYVITNNRLEVRRVKSLMKVGGNILISEGVSDGENVLTTRFTEAAEGVLVNIP